MATWSVEQRVEVWYTTTVEAETPEQAIRIADDSGDWYIQDNNFQEWTDNYWLENNDTEEQYTCYNGLMIREE